jgi:hypothetical protein
VAFFPNRSLKRLLECSTEITTTPRNFKISIDGARKTSKSEYVVTCLEDLDAPVSEVVSETNARLLGFTFGKEKRERLRSLLIPLANELLLSG